MSSGVSEIRRIVIPFSYDFAFAACSGLTEIGNAAFSRCSSSSTISLPASLSSVGDFVFEGCSSLCSINLPASLSSIGIHAFLGCSSLRSINLPAGIPIDKERFEGTPLLEKIWMDMRVCRYCGGEFEGVFHKVCRECHKPKDY